MGKILLVGVATDGPNDICLSTREETKIKKLFGDEYIERSSITPSATSYTLLHKTLNNPINTSNNKSNFLYFPTLQNNQTVNFGSIGGATNTTVDFQYTPYLDKQDLLYQINRSLLVGTTDAWAVRIGGSNSSLTSGNWTFSSIFRGSKYNRLRITSTSNSISISGMEPEFPNRTYTGTADEIVTKIGIDNASFICPVVISNYTGTIPTLNNQALTGGANGVINENVILNNFNNIIIPGDVSHVFIPVEATQNILNFLADYTANQLTHPVIFILPTPTVTRPINTWVSNMASSIPLRYDNIVLVPGTVDIQDNQTPAQRYSAEALAIQLADNIFNLTNMKILATNFEPKLSESELIRMEECGFTCLTRRIYNDVCVYKGATSTLSTSFTYQYVACEVHAKVNALLSPYLGLPLNDGTDTSLQNKIVLELNKIRFLVLDSVEVNILGQNIYVYISGMLPNEIFRMTFSLKN